MRNNELYLLMKIMKFFQNIKYMSNKLKYS